MPEFQNEGQDLINPLMETLRGIQNGAAIREVVYGGRDVRLDDPNLKGRALDEGFRWAINKLREARTQAMKR